MTEEQTQALMATIEAAMKLFQMLTDAVRELDGRLKESAAGSTQTPSPSCENTESPV